MALARTLSASLNGVTASVVNVEANVGPGLPGAHIVGLADTSISESKDRLKTAVLNSMLPWPKTKIVVSLSPASTRKSGSHFDLSICLAILMAGSDDAHSKQRAARTMFLGEVGLDGRVKPVPGILPSLLAAQDDADIDFVIVPEGNAAEAALVCSGQVLVGESLMQVVEWLCGSRQLKSANEWWAETGEKTAAVGEATPSLDMADVAGQESAKFAAEVAAAGGHHLMMVGPPGSGKSMIAARLPSILPDLSPRQILEATSVHSVAGRTYSGPIRKPPYVAPHHSVSKSALIGGGSGKPMPGAVSLAHHGVLFLDEVSEIPAATLDCLRIPLETGSIRLVRAREDAYFPSSFQLVLAANPCRCGAEESVACKCTSATRMRYLNNLSGPLRDRIDIFAKTHSRGAVLSSSSGDSSETIAARVAEARQRGQHRWSKAGIAATRNADVKANALRRQFAADDSAMALLKAKLGQGSVSQRGVDRALRLAWTLADLSGDKRPNIDHVASALDLHAEDQLGLAA